MGEVIKRFSDGSWVERTWHIPGEERPPALCWYDKYGNSMAAYELGGEVERNLREYYASDAMEALRLTEAELLHLRQIFCGAISRDAPEIGETSTRALEAREKVLNPKGDS